jgi:hypothetical protein
LIDGNHQSINYVQMFHQIESKPIECCLKKLLGDAWMAKARTSLVHVLEKYFYETLCLFSEAITTSS